MKDKPVCDWELKNTISVSEFEDREAQVAEVFDIEGALDDNRIRWVSYSDRVNKDNPYIDNTALKFIKRMVMPMNQPDVEHVKPMTFFTKIKLGTRKMRTRSRFNVAHVLVITVCIFLAFLLFKLGTTLPKI